MATRLIGLARDVGDRARRSSSAAASVARRRTRLALTVLTLVGGGLFLGPEAASAQTCIQDVWQAHGNTSSVQCTANDVTLSSATNIDILTGGSCVNGVCGCFAGQTVTFTADFRMDLTANTRYDVGFYIATDGDPNNNGALTGTCQATASLAGNTSNFMNLDAAATGDVCGEITTKNNPLFVTATISAPCPSTPGQQLRLPFATTWRQPGSNEVCDGTGVNNGTTTNDVYPGAPSKCNAGTLVIDITSINTTLAVTKTALTTSVPETGGSASYSVTVENTSAIAITLSSLNDDQYGDITLLTGSTCVADNDSATCQVGGQIAAGGSCSCTFSGPVPPGDVPGSFVDEVEACATNISNLTPSCAKDTAEVPYTDVSSAPALTKTASNAVCQIDVTYDVVVNNTSATESLTLNSLSDNVYGSITAAHLPDTSCSGSATQGVCAQVVSTTCGQTSGPGALPFLIGAAGNYTCSFVGRINSCDKTEIDRVTGGATDEDGVAFSPSDTATVVISVTRPQ